ncbi:MAG: DUF4340 domain-containing protein [Chlorobi bacterium]|nr:DUF4340 domain-containing protein [Chlorobiota bacterium]
MKRTKKIFVTLIIFAIIYSSGCNNKSNNITSDTFTVKDTSEIAKIIIEKDSFKITLSRNKHAAPWKVNQKYPANKKSVKRLYQTLSEVKIAKPVLKEKEDSVIKTLKKHGTRITIYNFDNKPLKKLYAGKYSEKLGGTFLMNPDNNTPFIVNIPGVENNLNRRWKTIPAYWINPEIFSYKPNQIKEIKLIYSDSLKHSFKLSVFDNNAKLFDISAGKPVKNINLNKAGSYLSYFMNVKFSSETPKPEKIKTELLKQNAFAEISVTDTKNNTKKIKLYKITTDKEKNSFDLDNLYVIINDNDAVTAKYMDFDLILKEIDYFTN